MTYETKVKIIGAATGIIGTIIVGIESSWWVSVGVLIMIFGNNIELTVKKPK